MSIPIKPNNQRLIINGVKHDFDTEIELFSKNEFGFDITISVKEKDLSEYSNHKVGDVLPAHLSIRHNCTEFHHLFNRLG